VHDGLDHIHRTPVDGFTQYGLQVTERGLTFRDAAQIVLIQIEPERRGHRRILVSEADIEHRRGAVAFRLVPATWVGDYELSIRRAEPKAHKPARTVA
jgi:hypothetical protein